MHSRHLQSPVVGEGRAVAPRLAIGRPRRGDRRLAAAHVALDPRQDVQDIGVEERVGAAFGRFPGVFQQLPGGLEIALSPPQVGQRDQGWEFLLREANRPGPGECMAQAFVGTIAAAQGQRSAALEPGGPGEIALVRFWWASSQARSASPAAEVNWPIQRALWASRALTPPSRWPAPWAMKISRARRMPTSAGPETPRAASTCPSGNSGPPRSSC